MGIDAAGSAFELEECRGPDCILRRLPFSPAACRLDTNGRARVVLHLDGEEASDFLNFVLKVSCWVGCGGAHHMVLRPSAKPAVGARHGRSHPRSHSPRPATPPASTPAGLHATKPRCHCGQTLPHPH